MKPCQMHVEEGIAVENAVVQLDPDASHVVVATYVVRGRLAFLMTEGACVWLREFSSLLGFLILTGRGS